MLRQQKIFSDYEYCWSSEKVLLNNDCFLYQYTPYLLVFIYTKCSSSAPQVVLVEWDLKCQSGFMRRGTQVGV